MIIGMFMLRPLAWSQHIDIPIVAKHHSSFCKILHFIKSSQIVWGSLLLVSATIQRYLVVTFPLTVKSLNFPSLTKIIISMVTAISFIVGIISSTRKTVNMKRIPFTCINDPKYDKLAFVTTLTYPVLGQSVCPILVFIFTCLIAANLHKHYLMRKNMVTEQEGNQSVKEFKITPMLFVTACVFLIPRSFQVIVWFLKNYISSVQIARILSLVTGFLVTVSHSVNFLVYFSSLKIAGRFSFLGFHVGLKSLNLKQGWVLRVWGQ